LHAEIKPIQIITLSEKGRNEEWPGDEKWDIRVPIQVFNFGKNNSGTLPVYVNMEQVYLRLHKKDIQHAQMKMGNRGSGSCLRFENALLFESVVPSITKQTTYAYFDGKGKEEVADHQKGFSVWCNDKRNLLLALPQNGEIDTTGWTHDIAINPGKTYMFGAMAKCTDAAHDISIIIGFHGSGKMVIHGQAVSDKVAGTGDWKFISGVFRHRPASLQPE